jgi:hypothetical protein
MPTIQNILEACEDVVEVHDVCPTCISLCWSFKGVGFGMLNIFKKGDEWKLETETRGKEHAKRVLALLVDQLEVVD